MIDFGDTLWVIPLYPYLPLRKQHTSILYWQGPYNHTHTIKCNTSFEKQNWTVHLFWFPNEKSFKKFILLFDLQPLHCCILILWSIIFPRSAFLHVRLLKVSYLPIAKAVLWETTSIFNINKQPYLLITDIPKSS